jgi:hypothetical protein
MNAAPEITVFNVCAIIKPPANSLRQCRVCIGTVPE